MQQDLQSLELDCLLHIINDTSFQRTELNQYFVHSIDSKDVCFPYKKMLTFLLCGKWTHNNNNKLKFKKKFPVYIAEK